MDLFLFSEPLRRRPWIAYAVAMLLALAALGIRLLIGGVLSGFPFLTFFPAVLLAAYLGGRGPGALCAFLSGLLAWYFLIDPVYSFELDWPGGFLPIVFFALVSAIIVLLIDATNRAYARLLRSEAERGRLNAELEQRVEERTRELSEANERLRQEIEGRAEAEARVTQLQRLEAVGQLTGGIAHDFNNMLAVVLGNLDLAQRRLMKGNADIMRHLENAMDGAKRGASLTQRLLAFARRQSLSPAVIDVNGLVASMSELLRRTIGERVEVECVLAGGLWRTYVDASQLESAIVNLAVNARDAMPDGGKLTIETMNGYVDEAYAAENAGAVPGQYVVVAVSDTGTGMPKEVLDRAFEPFFTTKDVGRGTGLGLSQLYGYLKQSGGHAKIYSEIGRGTTVKLYLPRHVGAEQLASPERAPAAETLLPGGRPEEVILVVEDEPRVRATTVEALRELGYTICEAADGAAALQLLEERNDVVLLFTDVVMPGMTGRELADQVLKTRPDMKILYTTGYTRNAIVHGGRLDPDVDLLPKPFTTAELARKVRAVLDR